MQDFAAYLLSQCEKKKSGTSLLVSQLAELWGTSQSQTYKKMRGQSAISWEEALAAARKYQFSLDRFAFGPSDTVLFRYPNIGQPPRTPKRFLSELLYAMQQMSAKPGVRIRYATNEIPVFYYLLFPELTAFKMFLWSRSVWKSLGDETDGRRWMQRLLADAEFRALSTASFDTFASTPSDEYYPINMLDNTIKQLDFLRAIGQLSPEWADHLHQQLHDLTDWMARTAAESAKRDTEGQARAAFELHYNEMLYTNNIALISAPGEGLMFSTLDNPNYLVTDDERMVAQIEDWFDSMRTGAIKISGDGERAREEYFGALRERIKPRPDSAAVA
jgi:hypothetical protein